MIRVVDANQRAVGQFYAQAYDLDGALCAARGSGSNVENDVILVLPPGRIRLVLTRNGQTIYDNGLDIPSAVETTRFETTVTIE